MSRALIKRACAGALLMLLLGGPTPGAVGSCGGDELAGPADVKSYCSEREQLICVRRQLRREISTRQSEDCRREVIERCKTRVFAPQCKPTERVAQACLNALRSLDTIKTPESKLEECSMPALCSVQSHAPTSIGADAGDPVGDVGNDADDDAGMDK